MMPANKKNSIRRSRTLVFLVLVLVLFVMPSLALSWPTNHLDSSAKGGKPYCTSCHSYSTGYLSLDKINGVTPLGSSVTVNRGQSFTMTFHTVGLGYGRFTVAGSVQVPDTGKWYLTNKTGDSVPWFISTQDTLWNAPEESPYIWSTAFSDNDNPNAQKGVTLDDGTAAGRHTDRNLTAHNEQFTVSVKVYESVPYGSYQLKLWGIGTASNGVLGYNEKIVTVYVYNDTTPPSAPTGLAFGGVTTSSATLTWTGSTDSGSGIKGYEVYRSKDGGQSFEYIGFSNTTTFTDSNLLSGTSYNFKVNAVDNAGNIAWGTPGAVTTISGTRSDLVAPLQPTGLSAFLIPVEGNPNKRTVKLTWNYGSEGDITGYYVYRSNSALGYYAPVTSTVISTVYSTTIDAVNNIVMKTVEYTDNQIKYGTTYYYKVMAVDVAGRLSEMSSQVSSTPVVDVGEPDPHGNYRTKAGMCQNCHSMHTGLGQELIYTGTIADSCYTCHDGSQSKFNTKASFDPVNNPSHHKVPEGRYSCDECHNPHYNSSDHPRLLATVSKEDGQIKRSGNAFCYACHGANSDLQNPFGRDHRAPFEGSRHNSLNPASQATGIVCRNCHVPHGSRDYPLLVSANSDNFCISCHKNVGYTQTKVLKDDNTVLQGVYLNNFSNSYLSTKHQENFYGRNTCTMCHEPHGSLANRYMLIYPYNDYWTTTTVGGKVYGPVDYSGSSEEDSICFRCHDSQYYIGIDGDYNQVTLGSKYGNGNAKNYHTHTAKLKISCRACHDPHSGKSAFHNTSKPAGQEWELNNNLYVNFDWAVQVGTATYSAQNNRLAFIPKYDANFNVSGYSCAIKCHNKDHALGSGNYAKYSRTGNSPPIKCNGCHDYDVFDTNSRHPVLGTISVGGNTVSCEDCHIADHALHNRTNPFGLKEQVTTNWAPFAIDPLERAYDPVTGKEIPAYSQFCWQCHGSVPGRDVLGDHKTYFVGKPHSIMERSGKDNPYGDGLDAPCLTCHTHHYSSNMRLLRPVIDGVAIDAETNNGKINACLACHDGSPATFDIAAKYNAATSAGHFIKADPKKKLLCTECHDSHGTTNYMYLLDTNNRYNTGIIFEGGHTVKGKSRWFCLKCHPLYGESRTEVVYDTTYTIKAGLITLPQLPNTVKDHIYYANPADPDFTERECGICHDPHKPWPATGGEDKCYECHSRPNGEATDIKTLMGLTTRPGTGLVSKHPISDGDTVNNTCVQMCHTPHPHGDYDGEVPEGRADHLSSPDKSEKTLCLSCHDVDAPPDKQAPYLVNSSRYNSKPHDYNKLIRIYTADNTAFFGNCDKCHLPHGSDFKPMLRKPKDELCVGCHNGVETDGQGDVIKDIKTLYQNAGHSYTLYPSAKLYCDECHIPHGSSNDQYLRDSDEMAPRQSIVHVNVYGVSQYQYFPDNLSGAGYSTRAFCTTCHKEYVAEAVYSWVYYSSETSPGGQVKIRNIPLVGDHGVVINEHRQGQPKKCTACHNPHDREPFGNNETCFVCHGNDGYATNIEALTGLNGVWPEGVPPKESNHPIRNVNTADNNDCMNMCHTPHVHNPRSNLIIDKRKGANDVTAPLVPAVYAIASSANQVDLKVYGTVDTDVTGYYVYRSLDNNIWNSYGIVNSRVYAPGYTWFYDGGLTENQTYYYKVQAFDRKGNLSGFSNISSAVPLKAADTTKPDIPLNVSAELNSRTEMKSTSIKVSWSPGKDNYVLRRYNIYRANSTKGQRLTAYEQSIIEPSLTYTLIGSTGNTTFTDGSLDENTTYFYRVTAVDGKPNESAKSAWVSVTTGAANEEVKPGYYYYRDGSNIIYLTLTRPEDSSQTPTNSFINGSKIKVKLDVPKGYFNFGAVNPANDIKKAKLTLYSDSGTEDNSFGLPTVSGTAYRDTYTWIGQVATNAPSLYQLTVQMSIFSHENLGIKYYSQQFISREIINVLPTSRYMKAFTNTTDRTNKTNATLVFKPGDTVYLTAPSDYPTSGYSGTVNTVGLYTYNGTLVGGTGILNAANYDGTTGHVNFQHNLPASGLTNDSWYYLGAAANNGWQSIKAIDVFQQILVRSADITSPTVPGSISGTVTGPNSVNVGWAASTDGVGVVGYAVYSKKTADSQWLMAGTTSSDTLSYEVTGLDPGTGYDFKVHAFDAASNDSAASATVSRTTGSEASNPGELSAPAKVRLLVNSSSSITVSWDWNANSRADKITAYSVFRSRNKLDFLKVGTIGVVGFIQNSRVNYTDNYLYDNTAYYYYVVAHDRFGKTSGQAAPQPPDPDYRITKSSGENSIEGALCMSCHDGVSVPPAGYTVKSKIGTAYNDSKHNVDYDIMTFKDGSIYRGNCTKCHVPHGSDHKSLLKDVDGVDLCFNCHESASDSSKYSGKRDYLLSAHGKTTPTGDYSATPRYWPGGQGVDSPIAAKASGDAGKCFNCHAPHGRFDPTTGQYIRSSAWAGTGDNLNRLCFTCHSDDEATFYGEWHGKTVYSATYHGNPLYNSKMRMADSFGQLWGAGECVNCHDPHGTQHPAMLRYPVNIAGTKMNELCLKCHDQASVLADTGLFDGSGVYNMSQHGRKAQWLEEFNSGGTKFNKTSFLPGVCLNCHNSHGRSTDGSADASKVVKKMLVIPDGPGNEICNKCHESTEIKANQPGYFGQEYFDQSAHKGIWPRPGVLWPGGTYYQEAAPEENRGKCINCHDPHGTAKKDWFGNLIHISGETFDEEEELCYACHKAGVVPNIYDLKQFKDSGRTTGHMPWMTVSVHAYGEDLGSSPRHVECQDCHNTHAVQSTYGMTSLDARLPRVLKGTWGVKITSWPTPNNPDYTKTGAGQWREKPVETNADLYPYEVVSSDDPSFEEYMLCFKCHASYGIQSGGKRVISFMNPKNASSHGFNPYVKNPANFMNKALSRKISGIPASDYLLRPGTPFNPNPDINVRNEAGRRYKLTCSDCHGNSDPNGPKGPHGSNFDYLLKRDPKNINFCTDCHYDKVYGSSPDSAYSPFSYGYNSYHNRHAYSGMPSWSYKKADGTWSVNAADAANQAGVAYVGKVNQLYGQNWCRWCHYAGSYWGDTQWVSVHGENASYPTQRSWYNTTTYTVYRGLNGYGMYFSITQDGNPNSSSCVTTNNDLGIRTCSWH